MLEPPVLGQRRSKLRDHKKSTGRSQHGGKLQNILLRIHIQIALAPSQMAYYYLEHAAFRHNNCREETESLTGT